MLHYPDDMLLSVIIPTYNISEYADKLFDNLEGQLYDRKKYNIELIFVDDCSTDNTFDLILDFRDTSSYKIKALQLLEHSLQGKARNFGMLRSYGKYLYFMDADDSIRPDAFERMCELLTEHDPDILIFKWTPSWKGVKPDPEGVFISVNTPEERLNLFGDHTKDITRGCWDKVFRYNLVMHYDLSFAEYVWDEESLFTMPAVLLAKSIYIANDILYCHKDCKSSSTAQLMKDNRPHLHDNPQVWLQTYEKCKALGLIEENYELFEWLFYMNYYFYTIVYDRQRPYHLSTIDKDVLLKNVEALFPNYRKNKILKKLNAFQRRIL